MGNKKILYFLLCAYIVASVVFYFGRFHGRLSNNNSDWGDFGSYFGGMMVLVSIVLLFITLLEQHKQGMQQIKMQHEDTFFKLLHYHRMLTDKVFKTYTTIKSRGKPETYRIYGRQYFEYAIETISLIKQSLSTAEYKGIYDPSSTNAQHFTAEEDLSTESLQECRIKHCNNEYLTEEKWKVLHIKEDKEKAAYIAFYNKHYSTYDPYIRRIKQLLCYLIENNDLNAKEYAKYIQMQMTLNELKFLTLHSTIDKKLKILLEETLLNQI